MKRAVQSRRRRKKVLKACRGYVGSKHRLYRTALEALRRALAYAYRDRRAKKGEMRSLWIARINAAAREYDISYSRLIDGMVKANIRIDRHMLADLAVNDPESFKKIVEQAKAALGRAYGAS